MKHIGKKGKAGWLIAFLLVLFFSACSDVILEEKNEDPSKTVLTVIIPTTTYKTRTGESLEATKEEKNISELHLYLFNVDGSLNRDITLVDRTSDSSNGEIYLIDNYPVGKFYAIVTANLSDYCNLPETITKNSLEETLLEFKSDKKIGTGKLPMVWFSDKGESDGMISLEADKSNTITAPLTFLCAKIRYTILVNLEDEKESYTIEAKNSYVSNIISQTRIKYSNEDNFEFLKTDSDEADKWDLSLSKYTYPENYNTNENGDVNPTPDLSDIIDINGNKFALQGIIYLPENLTGEASSITTTLTMNGVESTNTTEIQAKVDEETSYEIKRGNLYDITLNLKDPSRFEKEESKIYRIYWPKQYGPGLYIYDPEKYPDINYIPNQTEEWKYYMKLGELIDPKNKYYYYYEFDDKQFNKKELGLFLNNVHNVNPDNVSSNLDISNSIIFNLENGFRDYFIDNRNIKTAFIKVKGNESKTITEITDLERAYPFSLTQYDKVRIYWNKEKICAKPSGEELGYISLWADNGIIKELQKYDTSVTNNNNKYFRYSFQNTQDEPIYTLRFYVSTNDKREVSNSQKIDLTNLENSIVIQNNDAERIWDFYFDELSD